MTASFELTLNDRWTDSSTYARKPMKTAMDHAVDRKVTLQQAHALLWVAFLSSSILRDRRQQRVSMRALEAMFRLARLRELAPNWDSYNAPSISVVAIEAARKFMLRLDAMGHPPYFVSPGGNGEVLVQYKCGNGHEAEIWFEADGTCTMLLITPGQAPYEAALDMEFLLEHLSEARAQGDRPAQ